MSRSSVRASLLPRFAVAFALTLGAAQAQPAAQPAPPDNAIAPERPFLLEDAIALALARNFGLQTQSLTVQNAKEAVEIQDANLNDPTLTAGLTRNLNQAASTTSRLEGTTLVGPRNENTNVRVGAQLPRIEATNGALSVNTNVTRAATNSANALLNPAYGNNISATLNQPLLRDFGRHAATAALERAKLGLNISSIGYRSAVLSLINDTENAYYNVVAAREALRIRQLTLERFQLLFSENEARRSSGVATDLDVLTAEVNVANARRNVVQQEQTVRDAEERLLNLINVPTFDIRPGPVAFSDYDDGAPNFASSYRLAREYYPDTLSAEQTIRQLEIDLETARRNTKPVLDLTASLGYQARQTSANLQQAIANLPNDHGNTWSIGLNYSMPWGQRADKARYRQASNNLNSQKIRLEQLEQQLLVNVRSAVRAVETQLVAVEIAAKATELASRQYDQQKARYDAGLSTSRIVVQFQEDLENARFAELQAKLQLRRAVAELRRLEGSSIDRFRVQLPSP